MQRATCIAKVVSREDAIAASIAAAVPFLRAAPRNPPAKSARSASASVAAVVNRMAVDSPDLVAGVAYYGVQPPADKVPAIKAALLLHYAGRPTRT